MEIIIPREVSQKEKDMPHLIKYMWKLKSDTNEHIYKANTDS